MKKEKIVNSKYLILLFIALVILTVVVSISVAQMDGTGTTLGLCLCVFDLVIVAILFFLVKRDERLAVQYATNSLKVVTINKSTDDEKHVLMYVDNASSDKVVLKLYKNKVQLDESAKLINDKQ